MSEELKPCAWTEDELIDAYAESLKGRTAARSINSFEEGARWALTRAATARIAKLEAALNEIAGGQFEFPDEPILQIGQHIQIARAALARET